jgi:hypothetical protein
MQMLFVPELERALFSDRQKKALWDRFFIGAPAQRRRPVERYSIVKRSLARRDGENPKTDAQVEEADLSCRSKDRAGAEVYCSFPSTGGCCRCLSPADLAADEALADRFEAEASVDRGGSEKLNRGISGGSGLLWPRMAGGRRSDEQTSTAESHSVVQGEGGLGGIER